jgi:tripartite-type tricarboxylate transporter receptor subunit TctC
MTSKLSQRARHAGAAGVIGAALLLPAGAATQQPSCAALEGETIRWIVPYSPGGGYDTDSRLIEPVLERHLAAEIAIINMPGAGGVVGAKSIAAAEPDGRTLGIVGASGLLVARLLGDDGVPVPAADLTTLGRVTRVQRVWVARADSDLRFSEAGEVTRGGTPLLFGVSGIGSEGWVTMIIGRSVLGLEAEILAGYDGSQETQLGLIRGEFDLLDTPWSSALSSFENGEIRPVLQMTSAPIAHHPALAEIPVFGGAAGLAVARAVATGTDVEAARGIADGLVELLGAGRVVVAPAGLSPEVAACLEDRIYRTLVDPAFTSAAEAARRPVDVVSGQDAAASIALAAKALPTLRALVDSAR